MKSNKTLYETALEVASNDRKEMMQKDDSHKVLLYREVFSPEYTGYEYAYEGAKDDREEYLKQENKNTELQKYWDRYYNGNREVKFAAAPLYQNATQQATPTAAEDTKKNVDMDKYISKSKARAKSFLWAVVGLIIGGGAVFAAYHFFL